MYEQLALYGREADKDEQAWIDEHRPELDSQAALYLGVYHLLGTERAIGMAVGPIPVRAIWAYADEYGLDREAARLLEAVIRYVDNEESRLAEARRKAEAAAQTR